MSNFVKAGMTDIDKNPLEFSHGLDNQSELNARTILGHRDVVVFLFFLGWRIGCYCDA